MENKDELQDDRLAKEIYILDYLIVLAMHKKIIIAITLTVTFLSAVYSMTLPPRYKSTTEIVMPKAQSSSSMAQRISTLVGISEDNSSSLNALVMTRIITSRPVLYNLIDMFNLMEEAEAETTKEDIAFDLSKQKIKAERDKTTTLTTITVIDSDPVRAADMANALVTLLSNRLQELTIDESSQRRLFFEKQLIKAKEDLISAEEAMISFQKASGVIEATKQAESMLTQIAKLRAEITAHDVQLSVMKTYVTENNPDFQMIEEQIKGLRVALKKLEGSSGRNEEHAASLNDMPSVGTDYIRNMRNLKLAEQMYEVMVKQYESAKFDESKSPALIQVIQKAIPPNKRFAPSRRNIVTVYTLLAFIFSIFTVFIIGFLKKQKTINPHNTVRIETLKRLLSFKQ